MTQKLPCANTEARQFDFWVGQWSLSWPAEQTDGDAGETAFGTNRVEPLFGKCVINENFATANGSFLGRSLSVFDPGLGMWRQTWVDNHGSYLLVSGEFDGTQMDLRTNAIERDGENIVQRMVFRDITPNSLNWDWQGSRDGGESWADLWNITYQRQS